MGGARFPKISCTLCGKPLDLRTDPEVDPHRRAIHQKWYVKMATSFSAIICTMMDD